MTQLVALEIDGDIAVLTLNSPPVNALGRAVRLALFDAVQQADENQQVTCILIRALGRCFSAGADIREFGQSGKGPGLSELLERIENCSKPVVAAVFDTTLGGGLELAMAAHYRIAAQDVRLGMPEVALGLVPGGGGTQRLPRICGPEAALSLMLTGTPIAAQKALDIGLLDQIAQGDLDEAALEFALRLPPGARRPSALLRRGMQNASNYQAVISAHREGLSDSVFSAHRKIIDCVEAAFLLPFSAGLAFEAAAFEDAMASPQSQGLRHMFMAERRAAKPPVAAGTRVLRIEAVAVVGDGAEGAALVCGLLRAGMDVSCVVADEADKAVLLQQVGKEQDQLIARGILSGSAKIQQLSRFHMIDSCADISGRTGMVIEVAGPNLERKQAVLREVAKFAPDGAILVSTGDGYAPDILAEGLARKTEFVAFAFPEATPAHDLVEVSAATLTTEACINNCFAVLRRMKKWPVLTGQGHGRILKPMNDAYLQAAECMVQQGADPYEIDAALRDWGFTSGPFQTLDQAGLDTDHTRRMGLSHSAQSAIGQAPICDMLVEAGWFGRKVGRGFYRYDVDGRAHHDPEVQALIAQVRAALGQPQRTFSPEDMQNNCLAAMANAGAGLLVTREAIRPSDIDVVMVHGAGFPRWRGGPMHNADRVGLLKLRNGLAAQVAGGNDFWQPSPLFDEMIKNGEHFVDFNLG